MTVDLNPTVVIVEDDPTMRLFLTRFLGDAHTLSEISNGSDAVDWLESGGVADLVILDLGLPDLPGTGIWFSGGQSLEPRCGRARQVLIATVSRLSSRTLPKNLGHRPTRQTGHAPAKLALQRLFATYCVETATNSSQQSNRDFTQMPLIRFLRIPSYTVGEPRGNGRETDRYE